MIPGEVFDAPGQPLHLDIGCARGRFLLRMAEAAPEWNYLGVEIREPLVDEANRLADEGRPRNLHYVFCNAMLWLDRLLEEVPAGALQTVTIQFPDPWFKKKHAKRRMVNRGLVETLANVLPARAFIFVQTDIEPLAEEMFEQFRGVNAFREESIELNPFPVKTERELAVEAKDLPIYRAIFTKR